MTGRLLSSLLVFGVALGSHGPSARPEQAPQAPQAATADAAQPRAADRAPVPWGVGEELIYDVRFGPLKVGNGSMQVAGLEDVRGHETYRTIFHVRGGTIVYSVNDVFQSWIDTQTLYSLRFVKDQDEGRKSRNTRIELFPERQVFLENDDKDEQKSVPNPLDDGSFLYFVRTLPLRPGDVYELNRYFRPDRNPVRIRVLRRDTISVPAGKFPTIVVQPTIKTKGIFSEGGHAEVWISDDADRVVVQMKSSLSFGSLNLYLRAKKLGTK